MSKMSKHSVSVVKTDAFYNDTNCYHPDKRYPEMLGNEISEKPNPAYESVRESLHSLGLDADNYGTKKWNPFKDLIKPGMRVVIKPNFVLSRHHEGGDLWSVVTHPSVLRAIADYCLIAMKGKGVLQIADAPQYNCNFQELMDASRLLDVRDYLNTLSKAKVSVVDLRNYWSPKRHHFSHTKSLNGDPDGSILADLGQLSALKTKDADKFYGAVYHRQETTKHHSDGHHEYKLSRTMYDADVFISVPKLKVHKKVGVTLNAKGLVGSTTNKNHLVHYTLGTPKTGGDQFPDNWLGPYERIAIRAERFMYDFFLSKRNVWMDRIHRLIYDLHNVTLTKLGLYVPFRKRVLDAGNWHGNDSAWRMTVDLFRAITFVDTNGKVQKKPVRKSFTFIDGIIGGENRGPLDPDSNFSGVMIASSNLLAADLVATRLMGFDYNKVKTYEFLLNDPHFDFGIGNPEDINVVCDDASIAHCMKDKKSKFFDYLPHPGWVGTMEIDSPEGYQVDFNKTVDESIRRSNQARTEGR